MRERMSAVKQVGHLKGRLSARTPPELAPEDARKAASPLFLSASSFWARGPGLEIRNLTRAFSPPLTRPFFYLNDVSRSTATFEQRTFRNEPARPLITINVIVSRNDPLHFQSLFLVSVFIFHSIFIHCSAARFPLLSKLYNKMW